jgi:hypothetical protein
VLNFFNGDGQGGGFPTDRGADSFVEFERQAAKIVAALSELDADIIGLIELENDGYGEDSAIRSLQEALNEAEGSALYDVIDPGLDRLGDDAIAVGLIYRSDRLEAQGGAAVLSALNSAKDPQGQTLFDDSKNRPALAQSFRLKANNEVLTLAVNHLKSKGSDCVAQGDPDLNDGQGNCNQTRTRAAQALSQWLAGDPTASGDDDFLIIGDLNSYAMEDPISTLEAAAYRNLLAGDQSSFNYFGQAGTLDYALANASLAEQVVGAQVWPINADEPRALDYNTEYKSAQQQQAYYAADAYRSSDHDPLIIDLALGQSTKPAPDRNQPPQLKMKTWVLGPYLVGFGQAVDEDGQVKERNWHFGDGSVGSGIVVFHRYQAPGQYRVAFQAKDNEQAAAQVEHNVSLKPFWFR